MIIIKQITKAEYNRMFVEYPEAGIFYFKDGDTYIGIDNECGELIVEEFKTLKACAMWLTDRDLGIDEITKFDDVLHRYELGNEKMFRMYRSEKITSSSLKEKLKSKHERNIFLENELKRHKELLRKYESIMK